MALVPTRDFPTKRVPSDPLSGPGTHFIFFFTFRKIFSSLLTVSRRFFPLFYFLIFRVKPVFPTCGFFLSFPGKSKFLKYLPPFGVTCGMWIFKRKNEIFHDFFNSSSFFHVHVRTCEGEDSL